MHQNFKHSHRIAKPRPRAHWTAALIALLVANGLHAQAPVVAPPQPEQQGLPLNWRLAPAPQRQAQAAPTSAGPAIADQLLPSPLMRIDVHAPHGADAIAALLQPFVGKTRLPGAALEQARGQIWQLYRALGRLARIEIAALARSAAEGGSVLQVRVQEMRVHAVQVQPDGKAPRTAELLTGAEGKVLDLDLLDNRIKRRQFLGDIQLHAVLAPAGDDQLDVLLQTAPVPAAPIAWVVQADSYGTRSYGRNRYTAGAMKSGALTSGDRLNALATTSTGMDYGRLGYELPLIALGARMAAWTSHVGYRVPSGPKGKVDQFGAGLVYPVYYGKASIWTGYLDLVHGHQKDHVGAALMVNDKTVDSLQARIDGTVLLGQAQTAHLALGLQQGKLDLSALPSALAQDRLSARSDGVFTKFIWDAAWTNAFGRTRQFDARIGARGQFASKNLDESEKFALGGANAVRAYGSSGAMGDEGYLANAEVGYRPLEALRLYGFYDYGRIRPHRDPWSVESTPARYALQGAGVGMSYAWRSMNAMLVYARQTGGDPSRTPNGLDAEGTDARDRLWLSLGAHF